MFGDNSKGNLGMGNFDDLETPKLVDSLVEAASYGIKVSEISVGENHTIAIMDMNMEEGPDTGLFVWGNNDFGQLGLRDTKDQSISVPYQLDPESFVNGFKGIGAHGTYTGAVDSEGQVGM